MANDSEYGLGGAVWSTDINRCLRVSNALETGRVWVNCYNRLPAGAPFGGYKTSGIGRETHKMMLAAYTQVKTSTSAPVKNAKASIDLPFHINLI